MKRSLAPFALAAALSGAASAEMTDSKVNELIGQYLKDHPEAIIESLQAYQLKEEAEQAKKHAEAVKEALPQFTGKEHHYGEAGNPKGDVRIIEFYDYNCPACKMMFESIDALLLEDKNVHIIFAELPIFGETSDENAKVSMAVNALAPDKFYRFHQAAMKNKGKLGSEQLIEMAANLGIDKEALKKEAAKDLYVELIAKDRQIAGKIGVQGTPALIIGEEFVGGALGIEQLKEKVAEARKAAKDAKKD